MGQETGIHVESWGWGSIAVNIGLTLLNLAIAIPSGSLAVAAEMVHNLVDLIASVAVLLVVFFIARTGWELLKDGMRVLLDASVDMQTLDQVQQIIENDPATIQIKSLRGRNSGRYRFLEAEVTLRVDNLEKAHIVSQRIEQAIRAEVPHVERVLIHYEPAAHTHLRLALPLASPEGKLSAHFGEAPFFAIGTVRLSDRRIEKHEVIANPYRDLSKAKGIRVAEWLVVQKIDQVEIKESLQGKGPEYVFADAGAETMQTEADTVSLVLEGLGIDID